MSTPLQNIDDEYMSHQLKAVKIASRVSVDTRAIVIVGTGPVGMQFVREIVSRHIDTDVVVYGSEPVQPYNRVRLSDYLAGEVYRETLNIDETHSELANIEYRYNCAVEWIDKKAKTITDADGRVQRYESLVLVTGSVPFVPMFGNRQYEGVYTFRTLTEADELLSRKTRTRHTVVIGGGLLGLETARAMQKYNTEITIVEHNSWLMMQQLDEKGAALLREFVESSGIDVVLNDSVVSVTGNSRVEGITLRSGKHIACDTVIVAAGVRPNITLARDAGLVFRKGIRVDDHLQTSEKDIYAIGECAEHNEYVYGLVKPGFEQAAVLADRIAGGDSRYVGSTSATQLKVMSQSVFSAGRTGINEEARASVREYTYIDKEEGIYRKIRVFGVYIVGAMAVGKWHESQLINEAIMEKRRIWFWQLMRFSYSGNIWGSEEDIDVSAWPATATVCNCAGVTRGRLTAALEKGCDNVTCLTNATRAGSVCGSCKPLLAEMIGESAEQEPVRAWRGLIGLSVITLIIASLFLLISPIPYASSVQSEVRWDLLWRDTLLKQISGFSILGLFAIGLLVSLRKRVSKFTLGDYDLWRLSHIVLGVGALIALIAHTGFRIGNELNLLLMINFLLLAAVGARAGTVIAAEHKMVPAQAKKKRKLWNRTHIFLTWSLPVLLGFHVLKTYFY